MTITAARTLLDRVYAAFNARDIDTVLASMHPQVDWPNAIDGGRVRGHADVRAYWTRQWARIDPRVEPIGFTVESDGRVAVEVRQVVRDLRGTVLRENVVRHVYTVQDDLIVSMEIQPGRD